MREKFIKLTSGSDQIYLDPQMITYIRKNDSIDYDSVTLYLFGGQSIAVKEDIDTILKMIKDANNFKFNF
jgi:uncharacterized protein YlzI (FlbEa/FlbD family)